MHSRSDRPTLTVLVPATIQAVIEHPYFGATDINCLRALTTGSTQVPQGLVDAFTARGVPVIQVYGSTETCPIAVYTRVGGDQRAGSTGLPGLVCEARVVDDAGREVAPGTAGEVVVRGPNVFFEYWGNAEATAETLRDSWYHSGDIGTRDADGHFFIHDRKKNMIISGGENIYPAEVERVLVAHPDIAEAAVIGRADPKWQEVPVAYVVRRAGSAIDARALEGICWRARALQGAARVCVRGLAAAQRDGQGAALSFCGSMTMAADAYRGARRRQRFVRGGGRHGAGRSRGAAVAARPRGGRGAQRAPAARSW